MKKNKTSLNALVVIGTLTLFSQGCATNSKDSSQLLASEIELPRDVQYTVKEGDKLSNISIAITGNATDWTQIAAHNDISDPRSLRVGTVLSIPAALLSTQSRVIKVSLSDHPASKSKSIVAASNSSTQGSITATNALAVVQGGGQGRLTFKEDLADVVIQPITVNRSFKLSPMQESDLRTAVRSGNGPDTPQIKVIGSYFPKGIYEEPASYSTLIMRVAPGTLFQLERQVNDWYKVVTAEGIGYLRASDGAIVETN